MDYEMTEKDRMDRAAELAREKELQEAEAAWEAAGIKAVSWDGQLAAAESTE